MIEHSLVSICCGGDISFGRCMICGENDLGELICSDCAENIDDCTCHNNE